MTQRAQTPSKEVGITGSSFTGTFEGYFDDEDIYLESASLKLAQRAE
jgi:hypothetical protein